MIRIFITFMFCVFLTVVIMGCSTSTKTEYTEYYGAYWTSDNKIIAGKRYTKTISGSYGGDSTAEDARYTLEEIDPGTKEETQLLNIPWKDAANNIFHLQDKIIYYNYCQSPSTDQIKYFTNGVVDRQQDIARLYDINAQLNPSHNQILYSSNYYNDRFVVYDTNGNLIFNKDIGNFAVWKNNDEIFFYNQAADKLCLYNINSNTYSTLSKSFKPTVYYSDDNSLYSIQGDTSILWKYNLTTDEITSRNLSYNSGIYWHNTFSQQAKQILLTYDSGAYTPYLGEALKKSYGIQVYDLNTDTMTKIRD